MELLKPKEQESLQILSKFKEKIQLMETKEKLMAIYLYRQMERNLVAKEQLDEFINEKQKILNDNIAKQTEIIDKIVLGEEEPAD